MATLPTLPGNSDTVSLDLDEILLVAQEAARLAGDEIRKAMNHKTSSSLQMKSDTTDLVTETDIRCEELVMNMLREKYSEHAIIGEESSGADCNYTLTEGPT
mgnify:CR=1 FL=1